MDHVDRSDARSIAANAECPGPLDAEVRRRRLIGELVAIRREHHLTQTDVAREMGVSQPVVADIESGKFDVRYTTLDRYASAASQGSAQLAITRQAAPRVLAKTARARRSA